VPKHEPILTSFNADVYSVTINYEFARTEKIPFLKKIL
jgi:hypothetical protein